jgi:2-dehydro-3-deoxyphosphooctonate aldolase (KDO 8-P synthase)
MDEVIVGNIKIGNNNPLVLITGPCVIEDEKTVLDIAGKLKKIALDFNIPFIFKSSYEKNNRSSAVLYRGPGIKQGLDILAKVKQEFAIPVLSDVHRESDVDYAQQVLDIIQIPAFLCQQTSLVLKAGNTGKPVNIKKGQFL